MGRLRSVQILRAVAAIGVLEVHASGSVVRHPVFWHGLGGAGVDVFFVISGFVMTLAAQRARSASEFGLQRFLRVVPLYWLYSLPFIAFPLAKVFQASDILRTFFFWLGVAPYGDGPVLGVGWTLCFEIWFYAMVASAIAFGRRAWVGWAVVGVACFVLTLATHQAAFSFLGSPLFLEFALGAALAALPKAQPSTGLASLVVGVGSLIAWQALGMWRIYESHLDFLPLVGAWRVALSGLPAAFIVWGAIQCEPLLKGRVADAAAYLGDASYSIYLSHVLVLVALVKLMKEEAIWPNATMFAIMALCACVGVIAYELMERPLMRRNKRFQARVAAPALA